MGISKGLAMSRIINAIAARDAQESVQYDFVLVAGHFLVRDENIFTFFEGQSLKVSSSSRPTQGLWHEQLWQGLMQLVPMVSLIVSAVSVNRSQGFTVSALLGPCLTAVSTNWHQHTSITRRFASPLSAGGT